MHARIYSLFLKIINSFLVIPFPERKKDMCMHVCVYTFFFFFFWSLHTVYGILVPDQGSNPGPLQWKRGVLTTGLPGNSLYLFFFNANGFFLFTHTHTHSVLNLLFSLGHISTSLLRYLHQFWKLLYDLVVSYFT